MLRVHVFCGALLLGSLLGAVPAAAMTVVLTPQVWTFRAPNYDGNYQATETLFGGPSYGTVGRYGLPGDGPDVQYPPTDGDYASTLEFLLPELPEGAVVTSADLRILSTFNQNGGGIEVFAYTAPTTERDPSRLNRGGYLTTFNGTLARGQTFAPFDVTDIAAFSLENLAGSYLGFSFRQVDFNCRGCRMELGFGNDVNPLPILSITYEIPDPPVTPVPEPSSWALAIAGFGLTGAALRRRRTAAAAA